MPTTPRLTQRSANMVELVFRDQPDVSGYRLAAANTLDTAFAGATTMFDVTSGGTYRSASVRRRKHGLSETTGRGLTRVHYDPEDFWVAAGALPHDTEASYLRVQERNAAGVYRPAGPILVVPPPGFFSTNRPPLVVAGTAPSVAATSSGNPPDGALAFVLPRYADSATVGNRGAVPLSVAFGRGTPEFSVPAGETVQFPDAAVSEVFIRGTGGTAAFAIFFAVVNAEMA